MGKNQEALDFYNQKLAGNSTDYASYITRGKILVKLGLSNLLQMCLSLFILSQCQATARILLPL